MKSCLEMLWRGFIFLAGTVAIVLFCAALFCLIASIIDPGGPVKFP